MKTRLNALQRITALDVGRHLLPNAGRNVQQDVGYLKYQHFPVTKGILSVYSLSLDKEHDLTVKCLMKDDPTLTEMEAKRIIFESMWNDLD